MLKKIIHFLLILLFFSIPLFNSNLIDLSGFKWGFYVSGNYEFSKVMLFNILSGLIILLYSIKLFSGIILFLHKKNTVIKRQVIIPKILFFIIIILSVSTYFSIQPFTSLFGDNSKAHSLIMFINLIGIFIILINSKLKFQKKLLKTVLISSTIVVLIGIKEYYFPTLNYGNLENRALSTLGHPNYLALYILILLPFVKEIPLTNFIKGGIAIILLFTLILTKSLWGIFIGGTYLIYKIYYLLKNNKYKKIYLSLTSILILISLIYIINSFGYTKLHSFLSRFYIWDTTITIIFSDIKIFLFGGGLGTLDQIFGGFKSPLLYIYENFGYIADRPHNMFLNYFYHLGIGGLFFITYLLILIIKKYKNNPYYEALILFFTFTIFNFPGITHYLIIVLIGSIIYKKKKNNINNIKNLVLIFFILLISIIGGISSINYYNEEHKIYLDKYYKSDKTIYNTILSEDIKNNLFKNGFINLEGKCNNLIKYSPSAENYFYCGDIFWEINKNISKEFYKKGLKKLPDMRNKNSTYYDNILIKNIFSEARFYSEKFSNIDIILKKVGIQK